LEKISAVDPFLQSIEKQMRSDIHIRTLANPYVRQPPRPNQLMSVLLGT